MRDDALMPTRRPPGVNRTLAVVAWALAAAAAGVIAWSAVAVVGSQAGASPTGVLSSTQVTALLSERAAQGTVSSSPSPSPPAPPAPSPSASPSPTGDGGNAPPSAPEVVRNWTVTGGRVGTECVGDRIRLLFATPDGGWAVEVKSAGPEHVEVEFNRGELEVEAHITCAAGVPTLTSHDED